MYIFACVLQRKWVNVISDYMDEDKHMQPRKLV